MELMQSNRGQTSMLCKHYKPRINRFRVSKLKGSSLCYFFKQEGPSLKFQRNVKLDC